MIYSGQSNVGRSDSITAKKTGEESLCGCAAPCCLGHKPMMFQMEATHSVQAQNKEK